MEGLRTNGNIIDNIVAAETINSEGKIVKFLDNLKNTDDQYLFCDANKGSPNENNISIKTYLVF